MPRFKRIEGLLGLFHKAGLFEITRKIFPQAITILNYHRIADTIEDYSFKPNISADRLSFDRQMNYLQKNYNVISTSHFLKWLNKKADLPINSALITFDDGYFDNYSVASPVLSQYGLSATIFLAADYMGNNAPFLWDFAAYCFFLTRKSSETLPLLGFSSWNSVQSRDRILNQWVNLAKRFPRIQQLEIMGKLSEVLGVVVPADVFDGLYLNWAQIRELVNKNIEFGSHTSSHPILTSISLDDVHSELSTSKRKIEQELNCDIQSFAYPNGQKSDFSPEIAGIVRDVGYDAAFTLLAGPVSRKLTRKEPYYIRRIFIGNSDTFPRFTAKLSGFEIASQLIS